MKNFGSLSSSDKLIMVGYLGISLAYGILFAIKVRSVMKGKH
jgi:hypothetical protein